MVDEVPALYLDLLKRCLTRYELEPEYQFTPYRTHRSGLAGRARLGLQSAIRRRGLELAVPVPLSGEARAVGGDWPSSAETMIGVARLDQLHAAVEDVLADGIPGDLIETGVWRGGACILMRGVLAAHGVTDRTVWVADSFEGLPPPDPERYPVDAGDRHWTFDHLAVSAEDVRKNFAKYGLLDEQVKFLEGWFRDTLPTAPIETLAVLRVDGDMYESTIQALEALYPRLSTGGYAIVDDYALEGCRAAVDDFRSSQGVRASLEKIDWTGVYWRREA